MPIPPDTRAPGDSGHITDHNQIADELTALAGGVSANTAAITTESTRAGTAEGLLAPKASPVLTGTPTAPTAAALDSSTKVATTAYADSAAAVAGASAIAASLPTMTQTAVSASGTLALNTITTVTAATTATMTLPSATAGALIAVEMEAASTANVAITGNIRGVGSSTITLSLANESEMFFAYGGTWWPVAGHKTLSSLDARYAGKLKTSDCVLYVSKNGSDSSDGLSWGSAKLTMAAAFAAMPNGGVLNAGAGTWFETGLVPPSNLTMHGAGSQNVTYGTCLRASAGGATPAGDLFAVPGSWSSCSFDNIGFINGTAGGGGHIFNGSTSSVNGIVFTSCLFRQDSDAKCIWYTTDAIVINCTWRNCTSSHTATATVPGWWLVSSAGGIESNNWEDHWHTYSGNYVIHIESTSASSYSSGHVIRNFTWELCTGGFIRFLGVRHATLQNLIAYDNSGAYTTITRDSYYFGRGATGNLPCWDLSIDSVHRLAGTLATRVDTGVCATHSTTSVDDTAAVSADAGRPISGPGIPAGAVITSASPGSGYTISAPATASASGLTFTVTTATDIRCLSVARTKISACSGIIDVNNQDVLTENLTWGVGGTVVINRSPTLSMDISPATGVMLSPGYAATGVSSGVAAASRHVGAIASGTTPASGTFLTGDWVTVQTGGISVCTAGGTPGTWVATAVIDTTAGDIKASGLTAGVGASGKAADASHIHPLQDPLSLGAAATYLPSALMQTTAAAVANTAWYYRLLAGGIPITVVQISVVNASGNICVGVYQTSGSGLSAKPAAQLQTSGSVACPAAGAQDVALGGSVTPNINDWLAIGVDNTSVTFTGTAGAATGLVTGNAYEQTGLTGAVLTSPAGTLVNTNARIMYMRGH